MRRCTVYLLKLGKAHKGRVSNLFFMPTLTDFLKNIIKKKEHLGKQVIRDSIKGVDLLSQHIQRRNLGSDKGKAVAE